MERMKSEKTLQDVWDAIIYIIEVQDGEEREKMAESLFKEIMAKNMPNMARDMDMKLKGPQTGTTPK